jgi:EmrB/QacA subfamily drug resistance transporter
MTDQPSDTRMQQRVLMAMCLSLVLVVSGSSMLNVGLRNIGLDLDATSTQLHWIVDSYAVAFAALLLPFGALGDRYGRRTVMLSGLTIMGLASVGSSLAFSPDLLIWSRVFAGVGAAMVMPGTLSTITHVFPPDQRGRAVGVWAGFASAGAVIGLLTAGLLLEWFRWPSLFVFTLVLCVAAIVVTIAFAPNSIDPAHAHIDPLGSTLSAAGMASLVFAIIEGPNKGWGSSKVVAALIAAAVTLVAFVLWELHTTKGVLDVRLFMNRPFGAGSVSVLVQFFAAFGFFYVAAFMLQGMLGYSPLKSAAALLPMSVLIIPLSALAPGLAKRFGLRLVNVAGLLAMGAAFLVMANLGDDPTYLGFLPGLLLLGTGIALSTAPASESIVNALPPSKQGVASAVNDTARELGGAFGIAIIGSAFSSTYATSVTSALVTADPRISPAIQSSPLAGLDIATDIAANLEPGGAQLLADVRHSFMVGFSRGSLIAAAAIGLGALFVMWRSPRDVSHPQDAHEPFPTTHNPIPATRRHLENST